MKQLAVSLGYSASQVTRPGATAQSPVASPLRVLDSDGGLLAEGVVSSQSPASFQLPSDCDTAFVRLTWPSGKTQTQRVSFDLSNSASLVFTDSDIARNDQSAWAVPRLNRRTSLARPQGPGQGTSTVNVASFDRVWLRLWKFAYGVWQQTRVTPLAEFGNDAVRQIDFQLDPARWSLQLGGPELPWRLVSLPGGGSCRVLLTPNESRDPRADPLRIVVTSFRSDAEDLLEFLSRDALRAATALATFQPLALSLIEAKMEDPVGAVAGAYFLLRTGKWSNIPLSWLDNLQGMFPWLPDAAIIRCIVAVRAGLQQSGDEDFARGLLAQCVNNGLPVYAEGLLLMKEAAAVLKPPSQSAPRDTISEMIDRLSTASAWAGSAFSFYGRSPDQPSPSRIVGPPDQGTVLRSPTPAGFTVAIQSEAIPESAAIPQSTDTSDLIYLGNIGKPLTNRVG